MPNITHSILPTFSADGAFIRVGRPRLGQMLVEKTIPANYRAVGTELPVKSPMHSAGKVFSYSK